MNLHANDLNPLRAPYPELGGRKAMEAIAHPAVMGAAAGQATFIGAGGVLEGKTAAQARELLGVAPALQADAIIYVSTTGNDTTGDGSQEAPYASLRRAVQAIPRNLNGYTATIRVAGGAYGSANAVSIAGFGNGRLYVSGDTNANPVLQCSGGDTTVLMLDCSATVQLDSLTLVNTYGGTGASYVANITACASAAIMRCQFQSNNANNTRRLGILGQRSAILVQNTSVSGATECIRTSQGANVSAFSVTGDVGILFCAEDGIIQANGTNRITSGTLYYAGSGGRIYAGAQASAPSY